MTVRATPAVMRLFLVGRETVMRIRGFRATALLPAGTALVSCVNSGDVEYPNYGLAPRGFLSIQGDHTGKLSIRAMRIRELP